jgi:hypothetical protein
MKKVLFVMTIMSIFLGTTTSHASWVLKNNSTPYSILKTETYTTSNTLTIFYYISTKQAIYLTLAGSDYNKFNVLKTTLDQVFVSGKKISLIQNSTSTKKPTPWSWWDVNDVMTTITLYPLSADDTVNIRIK